MPLEYGKALPLECKAAGDGDWTVTGYLSTFGNVDSVGDVILPSAFDAALRGDRKVKFLFAHDDTKPLGPPLTLRTDDHGLIATGRLSKTSLGADVHLWLQEGALDSWSIGYWPLDAEWREGADGMLVRVLKQIDLLEGSIVAIPANDEAVVTGVKARLDAALADGTHGLPFEAHAAQVARTVREFVSRAGVGAAQRKADGRPLSADRLAALASLSGSLTEAHAALAALQAAAQPKSYAQDWTLLRARLLSRGIEV